MKPLITTRIYPTDYFIKVFETLDLWSAYIYNNVNFSFIKFGDGELFCMMGANGQNCDQHPYSPGLKEKLLNAWNYFCNTPANNIYVAEWGDQPGSFSTPQYIAPRQNPNVPVFRFLQDLISQSPNHNFNFVNYEIIMHNTVSEHKFNFFKAIKESSRKKIFVGPERLSGVCRFLNIQTHVKVPLINAFESFDTILTNTLNEVAENAIIIFSSSMPSKSMIHLIHERFPNITCLDAGSSFDAIFVGGTREGQLEPGLLQIFYRDIL